LSDPGDTGDRLTTEVEAGPEGVVLDIVVRTVKGSALVIADRHRAASLLDSWAEPPKSLVANVDHHTSEAAARAAVRWLRLFGLNPSVQEVFDVSGFSTIFSIFDDEASALSA